MNLVIWTLIAAGILLLVTPLVLALRCPAGWGIWVCYRLSATLAIFPWRWKATNPCTYPADG
ncbi:MAG: hypothetical protein KDA85_14330, partial [Planctomycetaceae bacterium]|nr:hypothetical protein [Planctomycetaceae bacterium]